MFWGGLNGDDFYPSGEDFDRYPSYRGSKETYFKVDFTPDPLFYFTVFTDAFKVKETNKAIQLNLFGELFWLPKRLVRFKKNNYYIHTNIGVEKIIKEVRSKSRRRA